MKIPDKWTDKELTRALSIGGRPKEQAIDFMMKRYIHYIPSMVDKIGLEKSILLDAFTDAIVAVAKQVAQGKFKGDSKLSSYFYKIFYFKSVDLSKKHKTNRVDYLESIPELSDPEPLVTRVMETSDEVKQLYKYLDLLGEPCKKILIDWGFWGYKMKEVAERSGLKGSDQAKDQKYRCLKKLRKLIHKPKS